jgi:hypothetical protein
VANTCELVSGGIPGYDGGEPAAAFARVRTAGKGGHGGKDGGDGSDDRDQSEDDDTREGAGGSQEDDDSQEGGSDDGSHEDGDSEDEASDDGPSHDDEVGVLVLPVIASYLATCTSPNIDYSAIVSVSQVHITTPVLIVGKAHVHSFACWVALQVIQSSSGDLYQDYLDNTATYRVVLQKAVTAGVDREEITFENVHIASVTRTDASSLGSHTSAAELHAAKAALAGSAVQVQYTILAYSSAVSSSDLAIVLKEAVSSGAFDAALQQIAQNEGAAGLTSATSADVGVNSLTGDTGDDGQDDANDDNDDGEEQGSAGGSGSAAGLNGGAAVGVAIAVPLAVLALVALALLICRRPRKPQTGAYDRVPSASTATVVAKPMGGPDDSTHSGVEMAVAVPVPPASAPPVRGKRAKGTQSHEPFAGHAVAYHV